MNPKNTLEFMVIKSESSNSNQQISWGRLTKFLSRTLPFTPQAIILYLFQPSRTHNIKKSHVKLSTFTLMKCVTPNRLIINLIFATFYFLSCSFQHSCKRKYRFHLISSVSKLWNDYVSTLSLQRDTKRGKYEDSKL